MVARATIVNSRGPDALPGFRSSGCFSSWLTCCSARWAAEASPGWLSKEKKLCIIAESCSIKSPNLNKGHLAAQSISREIKIARGWESSEDVWELWQHWWESCPTGSAGKCPACHQQNESGLMLCLYFHSFSLQLCQQLRRLCPTPCEAALGARAGGKLLRCCKAGDVGGGQVSSTSQCGATLLFPFSSLWTVAGPLHAHQKVPCRAGLEPISFAVSRL